MTNVLAMTHLLYNSLVGCCWGRADECVLLLNLTPALFFLLRSCVERIEMEIFKHRTYVQDIKE